jgi:tRNA (cytidine/uridine-2'-O-)-methyltransferase
MNTNSVDFFKHQATKPSSKNVDIILSVWEIGNPENAGQIIRLAHNVGASKVLFVNEEVNFRESKIRKTAGFSFDQMTWEFISEDEFLDLLEGEYKFVVLETCEGSANIFQHTFPDKTILMAGSESHGIPPKIIEKSDSQVHIPMPGGCKSMNISHALSVASFEWLRQKST